MPDDVILNKAEIIERCARRVRELYGPDPSRLRDDLLYQDAIILNLERACQAAIDLGMRWVRLEALGIPKESKDAFNLLAEAGRLPRELAKSLMGMVGFRNIAVHEYRELDFDIVEAIIRADFPDLRELIRLGLRVDGSDSPRRP